MSDTLDPTLQQAILTRIRTIPAYSALGIDIIELSPGFCRARAAHDRRFDGVFNSFHGGLLMTVADSVACFAIFTRTGPDAAMTTTDMNIRFLAPCLTDVTAVARVLKLGRTLVPVAIDLYDEPGAHVAVAQVTYMLLGSARRNSRTDKPSG